MWQLQVGCGWADREESRLGPEHITRLTFVCVHIGAHPAQKWRTTGYVPLSLRVLSSASVVICTKGCEESHERLCQFGIDATPLQQRRCARSANPSYLQP